MYPMLLVLYWKLAKSEELEMKNQIGEQYLRYRTAVPMFIPKIHRINPFQDNVDFKSKTLFT